METAQSYDFANILFAGPCNRFCPFCIGKKLPATVNVDNLDLYPLLGISNFVTQVNEFGIRQIVFTGTTTDPLLYKHQVKLLTYLRQNLTTKPIFSLHTNGVLALRQLDTFNSYDKACISFPSFEAHTYKRLMGVAKVPDLEKIVKHSKIEVKVSCVVNEFNRNEIEPFLDRCQRIGVRRIVVRRLFGDHTNWNLFGDKSASYYYRTNPVYDWNGMEVTYWCFDQTESTSINLFANGELSSDYLLFSHIWTCRAGSSKKLR